MEKVHKPHLRTHISKPIKVREFLNEWIEELKEQQFPSTASSSTDKDVETQSENVLDKIPEDLMDELRSLCSKKSLRCEGESVSYPYPRKEDMTDPKCNYNFMAVPPEVDLTCLKIQKQDLMNRWKNTTIRQTLRRRRKYADYNSKLKNSYVGLSTDDPKDIIKMPEVILNIVFYRPYHMYDPGQSRKSRHYSPKVEQRFIVLGSQTLTEVRDKFLCSADLVIPGEFSENPNMSQGDIPATKDLYKSGFFYIGDTFYNDMRDPTCRDYSKVIIDWAASDPAREIGPFQSKCMESTTFADLEIRLGYPYVYQHQGKCEHLMVFTDLRLVSKSDCLDRSLYPLYVGVTQSVQNMCMVCKALPSKWVTQHNDRLPYDTFFFCKTCFQNFNYTKDGEKIGDFVAYPYFDRLAIV